MFIVIVETNEPPIRIYIISFEIPLSILLLYYDDEKYALLNILLERLVSD